MSLRKLPKIKAFERPAGYQWDAPSNAIEAWAESGFYADESADISIFDSIGQDPWSGDGFTAKRMAGALRAIGEKPITVAINSPGGDLFEGIAIYNLLREHNAEVTVKVMAVAASAASIIAMAADSLLMGGGAQLMIHNCWGVTIGDRHDDLAAYELKSEFDAAMAEIYAERSGKTVEEIGALMDKTTWMNAQTSIDDGFADGTFNASNDAKNRGDKKRAQLAARNRLDALLAKQGVPRSERRKMFRESGMLSAAETAMPSAGFDLDAAARLLTTIKG